MSWLAYSCAYIGRLNYSAALASIISGGIFTKSQAGLIGTVFFFCYGAGQLINGMIADKFSPFNLIFFGLFFSASANLMMSFSNNFIIMAVIWGCNGIAQSMLWASIIFIISNIIHDDMRYKACIYIASSFPVGTLSAYFIAMIFSNYGWTKIFGASAIIIFIVSFIWLATSLRIKKSLSFKEINVDEINISENTTDNSKSKIKNLLVSSGVITVMFAVMLHGMLKEGIMTWVPTMISETYKTAPAFSIFVSMVLPLINLNGAFLATFVFNKVTKKNEISSSMIFMAISVAPLVVLLYIGKIPLIISIVMLALITVCMNAYNHMYLTLAPLRFKKYQRTATMAGVFNSITYAGCAISTYGFGYLSDKFGWNNSVYFWIGIAVTAVIISCFSVSKWKKFNKDDDTVSS